MRLTAKYTWIPIVYNSITHREMKILSFCGISRSQSQSHFYAKEKNQFVATLRALMFPITLYDAFWGDYQRIKNQ